MVVDHINGDTLDNRRKNLRVCSQMENTHNSGRHKDSLSGYKGVSLHFSHAKEGSKRWIARIFFAGKLHWIGLYRTPFEASVAYKKEAKRLQGEYYPTSINQ